MTSKKSTDTKEPQPQTEKKSLHSPMKFFSFLVVALLIIAVIVAVSWEKVIEPKLGFDLPDSSRDGSATESISSQPAGVHHMTGNDAPAQSAPQKVLQTHYQEYPMVFDKLMDTLQEQMATLVAESPIEKQQKVLSQLQTIHAIKGFQDGYISSHTLKKFLDKFTNIKLSDDITSEDKMLTVQQLVAMLDTPPVLSDKAPEAQHPQSWWERAQEWVMSSISVKTTEEVPADDAAIRTAILQKRWADALADFEGMPEEWQGTQIELKKHIKARVALDQLLAHSYNVMLNGEQK